MLPFRQPFPCAAPSGLDNGMDIEAVLPSPFREVLLRAIHAAKIPYLVFGEFYLAMLFTSVCCAVGNTIHAITRTGRPSQMLWIYTLAVAAVMGRVSHFRRARSVSNFTYETMHARIFRSSANVRVSAAIKGKRPLYALVRWIAQRFKNEISSFGHSNTLPRIWVLVNRRFRWVF